MHARTLHFVFAEPAGIKDSSVLEQQSGIYSALIHSLLEQ